MGCRGLPRLINGRAIRRASPLFLILILAFAFPHVNGTSTYVGKVAGQIGNSTCPPTGGNCGGPGGTNNANDNGDGVFIKSPLTGQLASVSIFTGAQLPNNLVILTGTTSTPAFDPTFFTVSPGYSATVADREVLSGLSTLTFTTISLANPVSVSVNQWVAVVVTANCTFPSNCFEIMLCGPSGASPSCLSTYNAGNFLDVGFAFGGATGTAPSSGSFASQNLGGDGGGVGSNGGGFMMGATFQTVGSPAQTTTQCYGNCGSPPVTVVNTISTHNINFNQSLTILYEFQSNLNGFILNETLNVAMNYNNGEGMTLGIYTVDPSCPSNITPFSPQCPGFLQAKATYQTLFKGGGTTNRLIAGNIPVSNGQWIGVAVSGFFKGLDLNDTNTQVPLFQTNGQVPTQISQTSILSATSLVGIQAWLIGNVISNGPSLGGGSPSAGNCTPACYLASFANALGGGVFGGLVAFGILFGIIGGGLMYVTRQHDPQGHIKGYAIPTWFLGIIALLMLLGMSAAGALPPYIPLIIIAIVAYLLATAVWNKRSEQGGTGATM